MTQDQKKLAKCEERQSGEHFVADGKALTSNADQARLLIALGQIDGDDEILDIWCGNGEIAFELSKSAKSVVATDYSSKLIETAKNRFPSVQFNVSDPIDIVYPESTFDVVVSNSSIHHYERPQENIGEAYRVLRLGGRIVVTMPIQAHRVGLKIAIEAVEHHIPGASAVMLGGPLFYSDKPDDIEKILLKTGFVGCVGSVYDSVATVPTVNNLVDLVIDKTGNGGISEELHGCIYDTASSLASGYFSSEESKYFFPVKIIAVSGQKGTLS